MFTKFNEATLSLQGKDVNMFNAKDQMLSLSRKLQFCAPPTGQHHFVCFPALINSAKEYQ
jgi:hypothetical protein